MWRLFIEATVEKDEGGSMPSYELRYAPTWALEEIERAIHTELLDRSRLRNIVQEEERRRARRIP